uniref:Uncharacterized protein n=1 Tax=Capra hircus TaxID=9925 RepID=A0A8C2Y1X7_CAPHI
MPGSALGLARRALSGRPFQTAPCSTHRALSRSAALRKVTKAQGGCPKSFVLWGCSPKRPRKRRTSLKLAWRGTSTPPQLLSKSTDFSHPVKTQKAL